jgi:hypothetical protein
MLEHMYVFPRRHDGHVLAVNALGFAGFLLIKSPAELDAVVTEGPTNVRKDVGCENVHETQVAGQSWMATRGSRRGLEREVSLSFLFLSSFSI